MAQTAKDKIRKRATRVRATLARKSKGRPRLSVFRSGKNIYAQIIDDANGRTLASASTLDKELKSAIEKPATVAAATVVGRTVAERAKKAGVTSVVFDRGGFIYHGRVKALADAAREAGLDF